MNNTKLSASQSPSRKCHTPSQQVSYLDKTLRSNLRNNTQTNKFQHHLASSFDRQSSKLVQCSLSLPKRQVKQTSRLLKTEIFSDHLVLQGGRVVHSRNEGLVQSNNRVPSSNYQRKMSNRAQLPQQFNAVQKKTRSSSHTVDKENFYACSVDKKRTQVQNTLNSSFTRNFSQQQSTTPNPGSKRNSLWTPNQLTIHSTKSTRKASFQSRVPPDQQKNFIFLENNQFQYNIQQEPLVESSNYISDKIKSCYRLIENHEYSEALGILKETDNGQLTPAQVKDVAYLTGLILLTFREYDGAVQQFMRILGRLATERNSMLGQVSLLTAVAYKKINKIKDAILVLSQFISKRSTLNAQIYYDAQVYRGKMYLKQKEYALALQDFQAAIQHKSEETYHQGKMGKADGLRLSGRKQEALLIYNALCCVISQQEQLKQVYLRKVLTLVDLGKYTLAQESVSDLLKLEPASSEALYMKGIVCQKQGEQSEAVLSYEQAIKQNNSRKGVTKSLLEIAKSKIHQRDFYAAYYTLQRAQHLDVDEDAVSKMTLFTEGVVFLMKRKYSEGVNNLTMLINNHQLGDYLRSLVFVYRAYGYICLAKYQKALNDLTYISNIQELESGDRYNKIICEGIILSQQNIFEKAIQSFQRAATLLPGRMEPYFYRSMALVKYLNKHSHKDQTRSKYLRTALLHLDQAVTINDQNSNLLYHRGLLRFYFNQTEDALQDFTKAIEKSEENIAKFFFARGLASACTKNDKQALSDFTVVINLDSKSADAYLNRAKVFQVLGDRNSAFNDLQKYISLKPHDPNIHLWAGNLLFNIGAYDNAVKAYSHSNEINANCELLQLRAQCYIILKELNSALTDLSRIIEMTGEKTIYIDREALQSLKTASMGIDETQQHFVQKLKKQTESSNFHLSSQIIKKLIQLNTEGIVFKLPDLYFYRGVYKFYTRKYDKAIENWTVSYTLKQESNKQKNDDKLPSSEEEFCRMIDENLSKESNSSKTNELEELEFEDRTFNLYEYYYNISIAYIMKENYEKAKEILNTLRDSVQEVELQKNINKLINTIHKDASSKHVQQNIHNLKQYTMLNIFPTHNRLCCIFPSVQLPFTSTNLEVKLSFCLPKIVPPSMKPGFDKKLIEALSPEVVENKPEAPWIKRNQDGIVFTDNMQNAQDLDLKSESQRSEKSQQDERTKQLTIPDEDDINGCDISINDEQIALESSRMKDDYYEQVNKKVEIEKLKERLQLDAKVKAKLDSLKY